ncbi:MAG TPA: carboxypeptidase-like regulatory domain-containing protein [Vicinamibacterales bacterium]|nr:carboxypeptidase-like regulatory domain-containing protein [Vicinamibacterales bacterium]
MPHCVRASVVVAAFLLLQPAAVLAQQGNIAGTVRDAQGAVMPGVLVEVTSPALIEKVRSTTSDQRGQYRIATLPVGTYSVTFTLEGFTKQQQNNVVLTTGFTAPVNATMTVGALNVTETVVGEAPTVDVQNARQISTFEGADIRDLPTTRNIRSILTLTPGLTATGLGADCVGGVGVWCNNNIYNLASHTATNDTDGLTQGRVMVDGTIINTGGGAGIMGMTGGYVADVANAQEVNVQISGALGESETGGASINIIPRTGGNRFSGNYYMNFTRGDFNLDGSLREGGLFSGSWFSKNNKSFPEIVSGYPLIRDYDTSGAFGGPIMRDRLWFFGTARAWQKDAWSRQVERIWDNANAGKWGANYQADRSQGPLTLMNMTRNANVRITFQASQKNKFNVFWDEGLTCQDPCDGSVAPWTARDGWWSGQVHPARLIQASWTNPLTNVILLEAGLAANRQLYDFSQHRYYTPNPDIPRVVEFGSTVGADSEVSQINASAAIFGVPSGPWADGIGGLAEQRNLNDWRPRASISYVTGSHNAKFGYDGGYFAQTRTNRSGNTRLEYRYFTPAATCFNAANPAASTCGNTSLYYPNDPFNQARRPVPDRVTVNTGPSTIDNRVSYSGFYMQDQWTLKRFTLSGALRFDHANSSYPETCIQGIGNGLTQGNANEPYVPVQVGGSFAGQKGYCTPKSDGVSYNDFTPRWGAAWDIFGTGKTSVKWNMGKYLSGASISGIYADANPAARTVNRYTRTWTDVDGDRVVDCNLLNFAVQTVAGGDLCGGPTSVFGQDSLRYGRDPLSLDAAGTPIGLQTTQCGRNEAGIPAAVQAYCDVYGDTLLDGWGKRRSEWQFGLGIQHELLPRFSAEVTYNRRSYSNLTVTDQLGIGCDRFNGVVDQRTCNQNFLNFNDPYTYDFYSVVAPSHPALPGGGGYVIRGIDTIKTTLPSNQPSAVTIMEELGYNWNGIDTNFVWRGTNKWGLRGLRVNGGTSTGRAVRDLCFASTNGPNVQQHDGVTPQCNPHTRWDTNVRGTAAYTIPKVDVLISTVFQWRPGVERAANHSFTKDEVIWEPGSAYRASQPCPAGATAGQVGCFIATSNTNTTTSQQINLLNTGELYGEGYTIFDVKLGKNLRFANKRVNIGVDIYNVFNNDAVRTYQDNYDVADNPATAVVEQWGQATGLLSPRFARLSIQFDF